jgi:hypothetical protein
MSSLSSSHDVFWLNSSAGQARRVTYELFYSLVIGT